MMRKMSGKEGEREKARGKERRMRRTNRNQTGMEKDKIYASVRPARETLAPLIQCFPLDNKSA